MARAKIFAFLSLTVLLLSMRIQGLLLLSSGCMFLGGLIFSLRCYRPSRPVLGAFLWTVVLSLTLFLLSLYVPNIRVWELLYL